MASRTYTSLVLDLGGVLASYSPPNNSGLSRRQVQNGLETPWWHDYERGLISREQCNKAVTTHLQFDEAKWAATLAQMMADLRPNLPFIDAIRVLKKCHPSLKVYCLSNIPGPEFRHLHQTIHDWGIIDEFHASSTAHLRKPDCAAYINFLEQVNEEPENCIFVDNRLENVVAARSLGFRSILFEETDSAIAMLHNLIGDPIARGKKYLRRHAKAHFCEINTGESQPDNYSQLLILQNTGDRSLVTLEKKGPIWNYFIGDPVFAETRYPNDADTTSLAMSVLDNVPSEDKEAAMRLILSHTNPDGLPCTWLEESRPRLCHVICANVFRFFYINGRQQDLARTHSYLCRLLRTKAYLLGSRYYVNPDWFLYILTDLCARCPGDAALKEMRTLLGREVNGRMGCDKDTLGAALRLLSAQALGLSNDRDLDTVLESQQLDGGWERVWLWQYGKEALKIGSRGVITAMALRGIQQSRLQCNGNH